MPPQGATGTCPTGPGAALAAVFGIVWFVFMIGIAVSYIIMLIAAWRAMRAHEKLADKVGEIADKLSVK